MMMVMRRSVNGGSRQMSSIASVRGREILDSRGNPTVEVEVTTDANKKTYRASVPSGASTGVHEAVELRDEERSRYCGKGVTRAVTHVNTLLNDLLIGQKVTQQQTIDDLMIGLDGTPNKAKIGANAILGVSLAVAKAGADVQNLPLFEHFYRLSTSTSTSSKRVLPVPSLNVINGGSHAGNKLAFQEFMILPVGADTFSHAMQMGCEVYHHLKAVIKAKYGQDATNVGDEGGFAPNIQNNREAVELLMQAIHKAGYNDKLIQIAMDVASSEFYTNNKYDLEFKNTDQKTTQPLTGDELAQMYADLCAEFPIVSIEDPFDQDDWQSYTNMTTSDLGQRVQVVGDDLLCTNPVRIAKAIETQACNALLLKVNQIGTISESIQAVTAAQQSGWGVMTSHRSGETEDSTIADLAVGLTTGQIKTGAPCRSERLAKYNQLLRIEEMLQGDAVYAGHHFRNPQQLLQ